MMTRMLGLDALFPLDVPVAPESPDLARVLGVLGVLVVRSVMRDFTKSATD